MLVVGEPGAGKSWAAQQLLVHCARAALKAADAPPAERGVRLVPVPLRVQRIGAWMRQNHRGKRAARNSRDEDFGLREFLEHDQALAPHAPLLERALAHRALFVVIDGIDEAGGLRGDARGADHRIRCCRRPRASS